MFIMSIIKQQQITDFLKWTWFFNIQPSLEWKLIIVNFFPRSRDIHYNEWRLYLVLQRKGLNPEL